MILLINYYIDKNLERQKELDFCLQENINNPIIKAIIVFHEKDVIIPQRKKIIHKICKGKPTYSDFFKYSNKFKGIKILANSDIFFNFTLNYAYNLKDNEIFALCRWNRIKDKLIFYNYLKSQDVWIWKDKINIICNFGLGIPACDNAILYKFNELGFKILSPSKQIQSIHCHESNLRNYEISKNVNKLKIEEPVLYLEKFY